MKTRLVLVGIGIVAALWLAFMMVALTGFDGIAPAGSPATYCRE